MSCSWGALAKYGTGGEFHLERRAFAQGRLDPNAAAVHFNNLFCDGETETRATFCLGVKSVHFMELLEDLVAMIYRNARPSVEFPFLSFVSFRASW